MSTLIFLATIFSTFGVSEVAAQPQSQVAVLVKPAAIPAFDALERGMRDTIRKELQVRVLLASDFGGQPGGVIEAARAEKPFVVVVLGTPLSQAFSAAFVQATDPPLIAAAISDPSKVLGDHVEPPRPTNITVVRDGPPEIYPDTASLIRSLVPGARRIGTVYNDHEDNSLFNRDRIREQAKAQGWELVERVVTEPGQVEAIGQALLAERVDAIWISKDRIMTSQPAPLIEAAHARKVPVFASDAGTVEAFGAVGTRSVSPFQIGQHVGDRVNAVAQGEAPAQMPISAVSKTTVFLSARAVKQLNLQVPSEVLAGAIVFESPADKAAPKAASGASLVVVFVIAAAVVGALVVILLYRRRRLRAPE
jgi:putative tryptophan/tyrosine transport system substrate-binding protein